MLLIFISLLLLIASIGVTFAAFLADDKHEKYIVILDIIIPITNEIIEILYENCTSAIIFFISIFKTNIKIKFATIPSNIPRGIPINASITPSNRTFFLICFFVAPIEESIPYCFILSVIEIAKLFLITNILDTTIIPITIAAITYIILTYTLFSPIPEYLSKVVFSFAPYFASSIFSL